MSSSKAKPLVRRVHYDLPGELEEHRPANLAHSIMLSFKGPCFLLCELSLTFLTRTYRYEFFNQSMARLISVTVSSTISALRCSTRHGSSLHSRQQCI
jgi:hypothetical protein